MKKSIAIITSVFVFAGLSADAFAGYFNNAPIVRCDTQITKNLRRGSENTQVVVLQNLLANAGFLSANPNGYFGYQTESALIAFQVANDLSPTGVVGPATRNALNERLCDNDLVDNTRSYVDPYAYDGYAWNGVTRVASQDPFVTVVTPSVATPAVYATPQVATIPSAVLTPSLSSSFTSFSSVPASSQIAQTGIVYNPSTGYTYGIVPQSGSLTLSAPAVNTIYNEGDTVSLQWSTSNLNATTFGIVLESNITGQSRTVAVVSGTSYSFVLTKELLDAICSGTCNNNQTGSFKVSVTTPTTDIAGNTTTLKATVAPITIRRPLAPGTVSVTASKTPVNSGEIFKLYVNIPTGASWNSGLAGNYSVKIRAICPSGVAVSIAGTGCGQEFVIPFAPTSFQQEIPTSILNPTWYKQEVIFQLTVVNLLGQTIGVGETKVIANGSSFNW